MVAYVIAYAVTALAMLACTRRCLGPWRRFRDFAGEAVCAALWPLTLAAFACWWAVLWVREWAYGADKGGL
jgi:hypothetical protein